MSGRKIDVAMHQPADVSKAQPGVQCHEHHAAPFSISDSERGPDLPVREGSSQGVLWPCWLADLAHGIIINNAAFHGGLK
jgi:hypothetical protein